MGDRITAAVTDTFATNQWDAHHESKLCINYWTKTAIAGFHINSPSVANLGVALDDFRTMKEAYGVSLFRGFGFSSQYSPGAAEAQRARVIDAWANTCLQHGRSLQEVSMKKASASRALEQVHV